MKFLLFTIIAGLFTSVIRADFSTDFIKNTNYSFSTKLSSIDSSQVNTKKVGVLVSAKSSAMINTLTKIDAKLDLLFEEGSHLALNDDSFKVDNALYPSQLYITFTPFYFLWLHAGIFQSARAYSPLLFNDSDLGLSQTTTFLDFTNLKLQFFSDIKTINHNTTETRTGSLSKNNSYYTNLGLDFNLDTHYLKLGALVSNFSFEKPNYAIASESRFMGATVTGTQNTSRFVYAYQGINAQFFLTLPQLLNQVTFYTQYIKNNDSSDTATLFGLDLGVLENIKLKLERYEIMADSIISVYAPMYYGRTNRDGEHIALTIKDGKSQYALNYYQNSPKEVNIFQDELTIFTLEFSHNF